MHYGKIMECDIANGTGVRVSLFVSGCRNHCEKCFNPETWDFEYGEEFTDDTIEYILDLLSKSYIEGITLLGGEPMEPENQPELLRLIRKMKERFPDKTVWCYTGYTIDKLLDTDEHCHCEDTFEFLSMIDVLVDGRYDESLSDLSLKFRGSSNQRIIDIKKSREEWKIILWT